MMRAAITALGMVTSVGADAAGTCAAVRAGIARPGPVPVTVLDRAALGAEPAAGHPVPLARGFEGVAVHALLAGEALREVARTAALGPGDWPRIAVFLCVSPVRDDEPERWEPELLQGLPHVLAASAGLPLRADRMTVLAAGHAGVLLAAREAIAALDGGLADRAVVVGVDSLVGADEAGWLAAEGRLKTPDQPAGLAPGQAAAALLLESARRRSGGRPPLAVLADVTVGRAEALRTDDLDSDGRTLAQVVAAARGAGRGPFVAFGDPNGETWRAREWGTALVHLRRAGFDDLDLVLPAASLGDTGAASGAIAVGLAARAHARGYLGAPGALVFSRSEREHVAAARVEAARS